MANRATKLSMDKVTDKIRESCFTRANNYTLENGETWCKGTEYPSGSYGHNVLKVQPRCEMCSRWIGNRFYKENTGQ